MHHLAIKAHNT